MFSPSPFPQDRARRSVRLYPSSPAPPAKRARIPTGPSRLGGTPRVASAGRRSASGDVSVINERTASEMDVDASPTPVQKSLKGTVIFSKSEELTVTFHAHLPIEVNKALQSIDFALAAFTGVVDTKTNYAIIASTETCFVWQHSQFLLGMPTCYIFPSPTEYPHVAPPFISLLPFDGGREPGLILLSQGGKLRFWDSIGLGLTGGDFTDSSNLDLASGEIVTCFVRAEPLVCIAATTHGRLFLLRVASVGGKVNVTHHDFSLSRPQTTFSRLKFWGSAEPVYSAGNVNAVCVGAPLEDGFQVWTLVELNIVRWTVMNEGWEQMDFEQDLSSLVSLHLAHVYTNVNLQEAGLVDLELVDLCLDPNNELNILSSFAGQEDEYDTRPRRFYAILRLSYADDVFAINGVHNVPYQTISADKANIHPRLSLLNKGRLYSVQFGDSVALIARDSEYNTCLTLKSTHDRTFGCGVVNDSQELLFMNSTSIMKVDIDQAKVDNFDPETGRATLIKSTLCQAILYGANPDNPLFFSFPPDIDEESLISGAEQLSRSVLASDLDLVRPNHDLSRHLIERKERLKFLIGFINENGAIGKMSQTSRQRLASDAEKLYAAQQLWLEYCELLATGDSQSLLVRSVRAFMEDVNEGHHEDILRAFFKMEVSDLGSLILYMMQLTREALASLDLPESLQDTLTLTNRVVLTILESGWSYRETNSGVYGITLPFIKPWTSEPPIADVLMDLFDSTTKVLAQSSPDHPDHAQSKEAIRQLPPLAAAVFRAFQERLSWLDSPAAEEEPGVRAERKEVHDKFQIIRLPVLQALLKYDHTEAAFKLAEEYNDFRSLAELCHSAPPLYPPRDNPNAIRIQSYIEKYKEEFTTALYHWYIEHGELRCMFADSDVYGSYIDRFFNTYPQPSISWIHDLEKNKWGKASQTLLSQAEQTAQLNARHVMLSIGKLAQLAELTVSDMPVEESNILDFHNELNVISVHQHVIEELRASLTAARSKQSLESQVDAIAKANAARLADRPAMLSFFKHCVKILLQGRVLPMEDLVDILTLKDKPTDQTTALRLIKTSKSLAESRRLSSFRTAWRRIFIHDNWNELRKTANVTDSQLIAKFKNTALYTAVTVALDLDGDYEQKILNPEQAAILPTWDELAGRFPGYSTDQLTALMSDYETEARILTELQLEDVFERVNELAATDSF